MVDMEDMVGLGALDEPATKVCVPACDTPCAPSLKPLTNISGRTLSRILGQSTPTSPQCPPVPSSSLPQQVSLPTLSSTVSSTTSPNHTGNQVSARLFSFSRDPFDFSNLHSKLCQKESTARWKLAALQRRLANHLHRHRHNHRHHCHCSAATAVIGAKITLCQQKLSDIVARKMGLRERDPSLLGVLPPTFPLCHGLHLPLRQPHQPAAPTLRGPGSPWLRDPVMAHVPQATSHYTPPRVPVVVFVHKCLYIFQIHSVFLPPVKSRLPAHNFILHLLVTAPGNNTS